VAGSKSKEDSRGGRKRARKADEGSGGTCALEHATFMQVALRAACYVDPVPRDTRVGMGNSVNDLI